MKKSPKPQEYDYRIDEYADGTFKLYIYYEKYFYNFKFADWYLEGIFDSYEQALDFAKKFVAKQMIVNSYTGSAK